MRLVVRQLVVGRPLLRREERLQQQQGRDARHGEDLPPPDLGGEQDKQPGAGDDAPGARWLVKERQPGERRDPGEAAEDVEPVGAQRPEADEHPGRALAQARHHAGHQHEDHAEADRLGQRRGAVQALEGVRAVQRLQDHREREHERHEQQQRHRRPAQVVALGPGVQEADADAEETCEQDEVGGLGHEDVVRGHPSDQGEFHEEHQEAGERQPGTFPGGFGCRLGGRRRAAGLSCGCSPAGLVGWPFGCAATSPSATPHPHPSWCGLLLDHLAGFSFSPCNGNERTPAGCGIGTIPCPAHPVVCGLCAFHLIPSRT